MYTSVCKEIWIMKLFVVSSDLDKIDRKIFKKWIASDKN